MSNYSNIDTVFVFQLYTAFVGDVEKTALAADVAPSVVRELAEKFDWLTKVKRVSIMRTEGKPGEWEICANRAVSFANAHIFRTLIARVLENLSQKDGAGLLASLATTKAGQVTLSAKLFSDLASALEKCHHLCYLALNDHAAGREEANTTEETTSMASLHASVLAALSAPAAAGVGQHLLSESIEDMVKSKIPPKKTDIET